MKWNALKKDIKAKEKECSELKDTLRKHEREASDYNSETESARIEIRRLKESFESDRHIWEANFHKEKQSLQQLVSHHACSLQELEAERKYLL